VFQLLDLPSQALAVQNLLRGKSLAEKIQWLRAHGKITLKPKTVQNEHQTYFFDSSIGKECAFLIDGDEFIFIGDHTTYTAGSG